MSRARRYAVGTALAVAVALANTPAASAQKTPAQRADELNSAGKELFRKHQYRAAAEKFHQATVLSPEGRLYWNLCLTRVQLNRLRAALTACIAVEPNGAKDRVIVKSRKMIAELRAKGITPATAELNADGSEKHVPSKVNAHNPAEPSKTGTASQPSDKGNTTTVPPNNGNVTGFASNPTDSNVDPAPNLVKKPTFRYDYSWSLPFELGTLFNSTLGGADTENYGDSGPALRFHVDIPFSKKYGFGGEGYLHINSIDEDVLAARLQIVDFGGALYKFFHLRGNLYIRPLIGAHVAVMQPDTNTSAVFTLGFRGGAQGGLVFGRRSQYVFTLTVEHTRYLSAVTESSSLDPSFYGLDRGSSTWLLAAGFSMRFSTPFGTTSIFTLE